MVDEWMATHRSELQTLRRQSSSSTVILALVPHAQSHFLKENDAVEAILRRFAKKFAGQLSSELGKSKDSKVKAAGLAVTGLIHGSEITETVVAVTNVTKDWLSTVSKVLKEEIEKNESEMAASHDSCVTVLQEHIDQMPLSLEELGCERHEGENRAIHIKMVSSHAKETIQRYSSIKSPERFFRKALREFELANSVTGIFL
jgi:gas vesicle protein